MLSFDLRSKSLSLGFGLFLKSSRAPSAIMPRLIVLINDSYRCVHAPNRTIVVQHWFKSWEDFNLLTPMSHFDTQWGRQKAKRFQRVQKWDIDVKRVVNQYLIQFDLTWNILKTTLEMLKILAWRVLGESWEPSSNYMLKANNINTRTRCEIYSKLTIKTSEQRQWRCSGVFIYC